MKSDSILHPMKKLPYLIALLLILSCTKDDPKLTPVLTWATPSYIAYGTLLSTVQLNASADVDGTFSYTPDFGDALQIGVDQDLSVEFTPTDLDKYSSMSKTVQITVVPGSSANFNANLTYGTLTDVDHNIYKTITIGNQTWMAENLRTTKYRNGEVIPYVTSNDDWKGLKTAAYSSYENTTDLEKIATYGYLYNWFAVSDQRNLAPEGWHVATDEEWKVLTTFLEGESVAAGELKEVGSLHWNDTNTGATNSTGFTALPAGRREYTDGSFINEGYNGFWWTSSPYNPDYSWYRQMNYDAVFVNPANFHKQYGFSVRCVKD